MVLPKTEPPDSGTPKPGVPKLAFVAWAKRCSCRSLPKQRSCCLRGSKAYSCCDSKYGRSGRCSKNTLWCWLHCLNNLLFDLILFWLIQGLWLILSKNCTNRLTRCWKLELTGLCWSKTKWSSCRSSEKRRCSSLSRKIIELKCRLRFFLFFFLLNLHFLFNLLLFFLLYFLFLRLNCSLCLEIPFDCN